jgi:hypothetical protein
VVNRQAGVNSEHYGGSYPPRGSNLILASTLS